MGASPLGIRKHDPHNDQLEETMKNMTTTLKIFLFPEAILTGVGREGFYKTRLNATEKSIISKPKLQSLQSPTQPHSYQTPIFNITMPPNPTPHGYIPPYGSNPNPKAPHWFIGPWTPAHELPKGHRLYKPKEETTTIVVPPPVATPEPEPLPLDALTGNSGIGVVDGDPGIGGPVQAGVPVEVPVEEEKPRPIEGEIWRRWWRGGGYDGRPGRGKNQPVGGGKKGAKAAFTCVIC